MKPRIALYLVQTPGLNQPWLTTGKHWLWDDAVKEARRISRDNDGADPARIRFHGRTLAFYRNGRSIAPVVRTVQRWGDGTSVVIKPVILKREGRA